MTTLQATVPDELYSELISKAEDCMRTLDQQVTYLLTQALRMPRHIDKDEMSLADAVKWAQIMNRSSESTNEDNLQ